MIIKSIESCYGFSKGHIEENEAEYASQRTREEVEKLLLCKITANDYFVFTTVKGDYGEAIYPFIQYIVLIGFPKDIRFQRVKNRSFQKFGNRILPGGDLYEQEKRFFDFVNSH